MIQHIRVLRSASSIAGVLIDLDKAGVTVEAVFILGTKAMSACRMATNTDIVDSIAVETYSVTIGNAHSAIMGSIDKVHSMWAT